MPAGTPWGGGVNRCIGGPRRRSAALPGRAAGLRGRLAVDAGTIAGTDSGFTLAALSTTNRTSTATGNAALYARVMTLVVNSDFWTGLDDAQRAIITAASDATRDVNENLGIWTLRLDDGHWTGEQVADSPLVHPHVVGIYPGRGRRPLTGGRTVNPASLSST